MPRLGNNYGEYLGLTARNGVAHPGWTDARAASFITPEAAPLDEEVFTSAIRTPGPPMCEGPANEPFFCHPARTPEPEKCPRMAQR